MSLSLLYCLIALPVTNSLWWAVSGRTPQQYKPYLDDIYDLGPIDKCVVYPVKRCAGIAGVSNKTRVPQFVALSVAPVTDRMLQWLDRTTMNAPLFITKECKDIFVTTTCLTNAQPICNNDNTRVTFTQAEAVEKTFERDCVQMSKCLAPYFPSVGNILCGYQRLWPIFSTNVSYSLTKCRAPNLPICGTNPYGSTTPEWIATSLEKRLQILAVASRLLANLRSIKEFVSTVTRMACTYPTCTNDGRLQGYLTRERCESAVKIGFKFIDGKPSANKRLFESLSAVIQYVVCSAFPSAALVY